MDYRINSELSNYRILPVPPQQLQQALITADIWRVHFLKFKGQFHICLLCIPKFLAQGSDLGFVLLEQTEGVLEKGGFWGGIV